MPLTRQARPSVPAMLALAVMLAAPAACDSEVEALVRALGEGCLLNSDCDDGNICVFRRCHEPCETTADCPLGPDGERLRCVAGDRPDHVCQLIDERECTYSSQCPDDQKCGPDGQCRDQCVGDRDCLPGQVCTQRVCAEEEELAPNDPYLPVADPVEQQETGTPCEYDNECAGLSPSEVPFVCRNGICAYDCYANIDCDPNHVCDPVDDDATTPGICKPGVDAPIYCVPGAQVACECVGGGPGWQVCASDGLRYEGCRDAADTCCAVDQSTCAP